MCTTMFNQTLFICTNIILIFGSSIDKGKGLQTDRIYGLICCLQKILMLFIVHSHQLSKLKILVDQ